MAARSCALNPSDPVLLFFAGMFATSLVSLVDVLL
jgi:hypothetical protein